MTRSNLIQEILNVITCSNFEKEDYFPDFVNEITETVSNWVTTNNVTDVEYTVEEEGLTGVYDINELKTFTTKPIKFIEGYCEIMDLADKLFKNGSNGPGWDGYTREDTRWNSEYLFTGSDCTFYTLIKKIA
jgi:hypothetical protein